MLWNKLKPLFYEIEDEITKKNLSELLGTGNEIEETTVSENQQNDTTKSSIIAEKFMRLIDINKEKKEKKQKIEVKNCLLWIQSEIDRIKSGIRNNEPFPDELSDNEFICIVLTNTLLHDSWYENEETTGKRCSTLKYAFLIFKLQLGYRLWNRKQFIMTKVDDKVSPAWLTTDAFRYKDLFRVPHGLDKTPIIKWSPERLFIAMNYLTIDREFNPSITFSNKENILIFQTYKNAILDSLSYIAYNYLSGPLENLTSSKYEWFTAVFESNSKDQLTANISQNNTNKLTQLKIKEMQKAQQAEIDKMYGGSILGEDNLKPIVQVADLLDDVNKKFQFDFEIDELKKDLHQDQVRLELILNGRLEGLESADVSYSVLPSEENDDEEMFYIKDLRELINKKIQNIKIKEKSLEKSKPITKTTEKSNVKPPEIEIKKQELYIPKSFWYTENMIISNHFCLWHMQEVSKDGKNVIDIYNPKRRKARSVILNEIFNALKKTNTTDCVTSAERWIANRSTMQWERERFRLITSNSTIFKSPEARKLCRSNVISDFEKPMEIDNIADFLDPNNKSYIHALAFSCHWWLSQSFPTINIDTIFFYWDIEYEYLSLRRKHLSSPVMSRLGTSWIIFKGGRWSDERDRYINCIWCGENIVDCLVEYLRILKLDEWKVVDRLKNIHYSISDTILTTMPIDFDEITN